MLGAKELENKVSENSIAGTICDDKLADGNVGPRGL